MLEFNSPNPPVPVVEKDSVEASYKFSPANIRDMISTTVIIRYIPYNIIAVFLILGTNLPTLGPGLSAFIRCML